jgi:hypothetical protein
MPVKPTRKLELFGGVGYGAAVHHGCVHSVPRKNTYFVLFSQVDRGRHYTTSKNRHIEFGGSLRLSYSQDYNQNYSPDYFPTKVCHFLALRPSTVFEIGSESLYFVLKGGVAYILCFNNKPKAKLIMDDNNIHFSIGIKYKIAGGK